MPGAGKSTIGKALAAKMRYGFIDSDDVIEENCGKKLSDILFESGQAGFLEIENFINATLNARNKVIATGGSAIFGKEAMEHFNRMGDIIYLKLSFKEIAKRISDLEMRGVAFSAGESLEDIYAKREPLYEKYAQITIDCDGKNVKEIVRELRERLV
jgi:shikimate kinase